MSEKKGKNQPPFFVFLEQQKKIYKITNISKNVESIINKFQDLSRRNIYLSFLVRESIRYSQSQFPMMLSIRTRHLLEINDISVKMTKKIHFFRNSFINNIEQEKNGEQLIKNIIEMNCSSQNLVESTRKFFKYYGDNVCVPGIMMSDINPIKILIHDILKEVKTMEKNIKEVNKHNNLLWQEYKKSKFNIVEGEKK